MACIKVIPEAAEPHDVPVVRMAVVGSLDDAAFNACGIADSRDSRRCAFARCGTVHKCAVCGIRTAAEIIRGRQMARSGMDRCRNGLCAFGILLRQ